MKLTIKQLREWNACKNGVEWFDLQDERDSIKVVRKLLDENLGWANWLIVRLLPVADRPKYALYAAELVYHVWKKRYPNNPVIRQTLDLVKKYILGIEFGRQTYISKETANSIAWMDGVRFAQESMEKK